MKTNGLTDTAWDYADPFNPLFRHAKWNGSSFQRRYRIGAHHFRPSHREHLPERPVIVKHGRECGMHRTDVGVEPIGRPERALRLPNTAHGGSQWQYVEFARKHSNVVVMGFDMAYTGRYYRLVK